MDVIPTLVRRGFETHASFTKGENKPQQLPTWGILMLACTAIFFFGILFMIEYTFGRILPALLMIESPQEAILFEPLPADDPDSTLNKDPEQVQIKPQFITASFRRTIRHLQSVGGFRARFRGLAIYIATGFAINTLGSTLSVFPILRILPRPFWNAVATVLCATLSLAWTHIVISEPSPKTWFRRLPPMKMWKKVAAPTAVLAVAEQLSIFLPIYLAVVTGLTDNKPEDLANMTGGKKTAMAFGGFGIFVFGLVLAFLIVIPAKVTLTRVQASLLSDTEETIVPFDRSFGGKVIPEIVGGSGAIGMLDAWKSFDWASRIRLVKAYMKLFAIQIAVTILFSLCLIAQLFIILGKDWSKLIPEDGDKQL
ncbi:hypothetical protein EG329_003730 [Mollisiaceae sp. DMI_Dod_QoI]|nr:hypothetical protein EG329_003730 [Helotiales sp. DMI_Dod_QoI]